TTGTATHLQGGLPACTATTILLLTGVVSTAVCLTPRLISSEPLTQARSAAQQERKVAAALDSTDAEPSETETDRSANDDASLGQPTGVPAVSAVKQYALPATAVDAARSELQTRTLVITRTSEGIRAHLISGQGTMLDDMTGTWTSRTVTGGLFDPQTAPAD